MTPEQRIANARSVIKKQLAGLDEIAPPNMHPQRELRDAGERYERFERWQDRTERLIRTNISGEEADKFNPKVSLGIGASDHWNLYYDSGKRRTFLNALDHELANHPEDFFEPAESRAPVNNDQEKSEVSPDPIIFIIHGHDKSNTLTLEKVLRDRFKLKTIVLVDKPHAGRTIIEKFEQEAAPAAFAFAVLTPDDLVLKGDEEYRQSRPNVHFELGYFYGRLGRGRVSLLLGRGTSVPTDLSGVGYHSFRADVAEVSANIEDELIHAKILPRR